MDELEKLERKWRERAEFYTKLQPAADVIVDELSALGQTHTTIPREPSEAELDRLIAAIRDGILGELAVTPLSNEEIRKQWEPIARAAYKAITDGR